jgi:S-adenosylmethionine synthetase
MDLIIKLQSDFEYLKEDLNEHKNNGIIHIGKIWGVITAIIAVMITLIPH